MHSLSFLVFLSSLERLKNEILRLNDFFNFIVMWICTLEFCSVWGTLFITEMLLFVNSLSFSQAKTVAFSTQDSKLFSFRFRSIWDDRPKNKYCKLFVVALSDLSRLSLVHFKDWKDVLFYSALCQMQHNSSFKNKFLIETPDWS